MLYVISAAFFLLGITVFIFGIGYLLRFLVHIITGNFSSVRAAVLILIIGSVCTTIGSILIWAYAPLVYT